MNITRAVVFFSVLVTFLGRPDPATACSCRPGLPVRDALRESDAVYFGKVIASRDMDVTERGSSLNIGYTFRVSRAWKGVSTDTVEVGTARGSTACGVHFEVGEEYLVYVYAGRDSAAYLTSLLGEKLTQTSEGVAYWTNTCMRTTHVRYAQEDLKELGKPSWVSARHGDDTEEQ